MKAANIHRKTADIESTLNRWLEENEEEIAEIVQTAMSTDIVPGETSGLPIPWSNVIIIYRPKQQALAITSEEYRS